MSNTFLHGVISSTTLNFLEALAQNQATAMNNLAGIPIAGSRRYLIRSITVIAKENYGPELNFFSTAAGLTTDPATDTFIGRFGFVSSMGERIAATGLYRYYIDGLAIPYFDQDAASSQAPSKLHVILQNVSATAKSADAAGATRVTVRLEEMQAY